MLTRLRHLLARLIVLIIFSPTIAAIIYFGIVAADRYVSEAQFVIRTASKPIGMSGFSAFLQMAGLSKSQDDVYSVKEFLGSRDAAKQLGERVPLREIFGDPAADFITRYPSIFYGDTQEQLHRYLQWMVTANYSIKTGLTTLRVHAFKPEHAKLVAIALLELGERKVNRLNERIQDDAIRTAEFEVKHAESRLVSAQVALTKFRNSEAILDPSSSAIILVEIIGGLSAEAARIQAQLREAIAATPDGPLVPALKGRLKAVEAQIGAERKKIAAGDGALASKLSAYEKLSLEVEFAKGQLAAADRGLEGARNEARRQQLYLERVVEPNLPDIPTAPERLRSVGTVFIINFVACLVMWLFYAGIRERAEEHSRE